MGDPITAIPLPWKPPSALAPPGVPLRNISPQLLSSSCADYLVPVIFALQGAEAWPLNEMADQLATFRTRLLALGDVR